jgi:hypothetical protein
MAIMDHEVTLLDNDDAEIIWDFGDGTVVSPKDVE